MNFNFLNAALITTFLFANAFAAERAPIRVVKETCDINEVLQFATKRTLVVFDFDHVIAKNRNPIGGDAWFGKMLNKITACDFTIPQAKSKLIPVYDNYQMVAEVDPVTHDVVEVIKELQDRGITVIIATIRSVSLIDATLRQLASLRIDMTRTMLQPETLKKYDTNKLVYKNGVLCCDGADKGESLFALIGDNPNYTFAFDEICFVDDSLRHVNSVQKLAAKMGLDYYGLRYNVMDDFVKSYELDNDSLRLAELMISELKNETIFRAMPLPC